MSVKRYDVDYEGFIMQVDCGEFVSHEDYSKLEQDHKAAMLTISNITKLLGVSDTMSVSKQVEKLVDQVEKFIEQNLELVDRLAATKAYAEYLEVTTK